MKKLYAAILIALALTLAACTQTTPDDAETSATPPLSSPTVTPTHTPTIPAGEPHTFTFNGADMRVGDIAAPVLDALGEPFDVFEAPSCAFQGVDITYFYAGFELSTYPGDDGEEHILSIALTDDSVETPEELYIGAPEAEVFAAYGDGGAVEHGRVTYEKGCGTLVFLFEDGKVSSIAYNLIIE